jgi:hypothetical protein
MLVVNGNINLILLKLIFKEKLVAKENSRIFYRTSQIFETLQRKKTQARHRSRKSIPELQSWSMKYLVNNTPWTREKKSMKFIFQVLLDLLHHQN